MFYVCVASRSHKKVYKIERSKDTALGSLSRVIDFFISFLNVLIKNGLTWHNMLSCSLGPCMPYENERNNALGFGKIAKTVDDQNSLRIILLLID